MTQQAQHETMKLHVQTQGHWCPRSAAFLLAGLLGLLGGEARADQGRSDTARAVQSNSDAPDNTSGEPRGCYPPCRRGFTCHMSACVSLCNPPCGSGETCVAGECRMGPKAPGRARRRDPVYLALLGGYRAGLNDVADGTGDLRAEFGGRHVALQIGPSFGDHSTTIRGAVVGNVPIRLAPTLPLYVVPMIQLGYAFNWIDDTAETRQQDFFITLVPGCATTSPNAWRSCST